MKADLPTLLQRQAGPAHLRGKETITRLLPTGKLRQRRERPHPWAPNAYWNQHLSLCPSGIRTEVTVELVFSTERTGMYKDERGTM